MAHIFISYAKKDTRQLAVDLFDALNAIDGLSAWMDTSLDADASWALQIQEEIDKADYVIVLLSPDVNRKITATQRRSFVLNEIDYAQQDNKLILPVMVVATKTPVQIAGVQYLDVTQTPTDPSSIIERVCERYNIETPDERRQREAQEQERLSEQAALQERRHQEQTDRDQAERRQREKQAKEAADRLERERLAREQPAPAPKPRPAPPTSAPSLEPNRPSPGFLSGIIGGVIIVVLVAAFFLSSRRGLPTYRMVTDEILQSAHTAITRNADWLPAERDFGGVAMLLVPTGCFQMGNGSGQDDDENGGKVCVNPFWLDKTEVTQAQFVAKNGVKTSANTFTGDNRPVHQITWFEAQDYCAGRKGRLPTEAEWEYAARGPDGLVYPWRDEFVGDNAVYADNSNDQTAEVGSRLGGVSWAGAFDLSGNVSEWTSSLYEDYPYDSDDDEREDLTASGWRVVRGGSWNDGDDGLRAANRVSVAPDSFTNYIGFRCAGP